MTEIINGKVCHILQNGSTGPVLYWGITPDGHALVEATAQQLRRLAKQQSWLLAAYEADDWNRDFSPWAAPPAFGKQAFEGGGAQTLDWLLGSCIPCIEKESRINKKCRINYEITDRFIGGYSLAGLFSLWAFYTSGQFRGAASCSGSLWYPDWDHFMQGRTAPPDSLLYLSLGIKEEQTNNRIMATVGDAARRQYQLAQADKNIADSTLEWNPGRHFTEPERRTAKGFAWLLNHH